MNYTLKLTITAPRAKVCALFVNPENWQHWQKSLVSYQPISGEYGSAGGQTQLVHQFGRKHTEMIETIESNDLPDELVCVYEAAGVYNRVVNRFSEVSADETEWQFESEFRCQGLMKLMTAIMPWMFKSASKNDMAAFKHFAESASRA